MNQNETPKLPKGWEMKKLGEVCEVKPPKEEARNKIKSFDKVSFLPMEDLGICSKNINFKKEKTLAEVVGSYTYFGEGDVLLAKITPCFENGKLGIARNLINSIGFGSSEFIVFRPNQKIFNEYLFYFLSQESFRKKGSLRMNGAVGHKRLDKEFILSYPIPLPPLPEQKRIVAKLDEVFTAIAKAKANAEQNLKNAKELFESYLQLSMDNGKSKIGKGWEVKKLGELGNPKMCKRIFKEQTSTNGDIPFYKIGTFGKQSDAFISKKIYDEYKTNYPFPNKGEVLISASGTIGRCIKYDGKPAYFQDSNIVWIENDEKLVSNDFLFEFYRSCKWGSTKGATISRLYNDNLKNTKIYFPKSKTEQKHIVAKLDALKAETTQLEKIYKQKIASLNELKKAILSKAFEGEL